MLVPVMLAFGYMPSVALVLALPLLTLLAAGFALGVGLWLSALNVEYRDVRHAVPFVVQVWMFLTPVIWPLSKLEPPYRWLAALNPMAGVVEGFRAAVLGQPWDWVALAMACAVTVTTLVTGAFYFRRLERSFADVV
jgi:lipopolysaccharide transport system permease protein